MDGKLQSTVRDCSRVLALDKGLNAVELCSTDELVGVLEQFKTAADSVKMNEMIATQLATRKLVNTQKQRG